MRIHNPQSNEDLLPDLHRTLAALRWRRGFDPGRYIRAKATVLNEYMRASQLNACVVGVSGGVDSALVLALVDHARRQHKSPIKRVIGATMPIFDCGATNQDSAAARGRAAAERFGAEVVQVDLTAAHVALKSAVDSALKVTGEPWASGQLVSYARTPALYYITSLLTQQGDSGILVGTTNRDEGSYLGFIGKASDAMVDVQLISDLHKSEVYAAARAVGVPESVLSATPSGDMFDARADVEVFGAPYDFVELYLLLKDLRYDLERESVTRGWSCEAREQFERLSANLDNLHRYNRHKYLGRSPAVHLDILRSSTPGGWNNSLYLTHRDPVPDKSVLNGLFDVPRDFVNRILSAPDPNITAEPVLDLGDSAILLHDVFSSMEVEDLLTILGRQQWVPVGTDGRRSNAQADRAIGGSWRATAYDSEFALAIWNRIGRFSCSPRIMDDTTATDWDGTRIWKAVGVSPVLRFIQYRKGGALIPHYDAPYIYHEGKRTLVSLILYLDVDECAGGATRIIADPQAQVPVSGRDLADWKRFGTEEEVLCRIPARFGSCLLMDHRVLHDAEEYSGSTQKVILRTDLVFERCGTAPRDV